MIHTIADGETNRDVSAENRNIKKRDMQKATALGLSTDIQNISVMMNTKNMENTTSDRINSHR
jgi:predicted porin